MGKMFVTDTNKEKNMGLYLSMIHKK